MAEDHSPLSPTDILNSCREHLANNGSQQEQESFERSVVRTSKPNVMDMWQALKSMINQFPLPQLGLYDQLFYSAQVYEDTFHEQPSLSTLLSPKAHSWATGETLVYYAIIRAAVKADLVLKGDSDLPHLLELIAIQYLSLIHI